MSDIDPTQGLENAPGTGGNEPSGEQQQQQASNEPASFDHPFLSNIPDTDKAVVGRYIQQWDANVQRRFADIHRQYEPYKNLGELEDIQQAIQIYEYLRRDPRGFYEQLSQSAGFNNQQQQVQQLQPNGQGQFGNQQPQYPEELAPLYQQFDSRFTEFQKTQQQQNEVLMALANGFLEERNRATQMAEDSELDQYLGFLKTEFGNFDEEYVLLKMQAGMDGESAVQAYRQAIQQQVNANATPQPGPVLSGGGGTPPSAKRVEDLSRKDTVSLVADVLARANQD